MTKRKGAAPENISLRCPCCTTKLIIDRATGAIVYEERPKKVGPSWDDALQAGKRKQAEAEEMFSEGMHRERHADEILEKKFREAVKRADKSDTPPPRIFDYD